MDSSYKVSDDVSGREQQQQQQRSIKFLKGLLANIESLEERVAAQRLLESMERKGEGEGEGEGESKANKVFDIAELVTPIIEDLGTKDLATIARLNKATYDAVEKCPAVRRRLFLEPDREAFFSAPFARPRDLFVAPASRGAFKFVLDSITRYDGEAGEDEIIGWLLAFDIDSDEAFSRPLSKQALDRLICQPPVYGVEARTSCCVDMAAGPPTQIITSYTGITVRQLLETRNSLRDEHKMCTNHGDPILDEHDPTDGYVKPNVIFSGQIGLDRYDPVVATEEQKTNDERLADHIHEQRRTKLTGYMKAKRAGKSFTYYNETPIPTLAEYQEEVELWISQNRAYGDQ